MLLPTGGGARPAATTCGRRSAAPTCQRPAEPVPRHLSSRTRPAKRGSHRGQPPPCARGAVGRSAHGRLNLDATDSHSPPQLSRPHPCRGASPYRAVSSSSPSRERGSRAPTVVRDHHFCLAICVGSQLIRAVGEKQSIGNESLPDRAGRKKERRHGKHGQADWILTVQTGAIWSFQGDVK